MRKALIILLILLAPWLVQVVLAATEHRDVQTFLNTLSVGGGRGQSLNFKVNTVTETTDSGAATDTITGLIPAGATCLSVTCRVTTVLAGSGLTTWSLGDGTDADLYGTALTLTLGTTVDHSDYTAGPLTQAWSASAGNLTMTAAAGQFDSGEIVCSCVYMDVTAPTG